MESIEHRVHECGHQRVFRAFGVHSVISDNLCTPEPHEPLSLIAWITVLLGGITAEHLAGVEFLTNGSGGDAKLIMQALGADMTKECAYSVAICLIVEGRTPHKLLGIPEEHIKLLQQAAATAEKILGEIKCPIYFFIWPTATMQSSPRPRASHTGT